MRDGILAVLVFGLLPFIFRHPELGAYMWAWMSIMNPHRLAYGFARQFPFAFVIALTTMAAFALTPHRKRLPMNALMAVYVTLMLWMSLTSLVSINSPEVVLDRWLFVIKVHVMMLITLMLLRDRRQIDWLIWVVVVSIGFYGVKGGIWTIATGGGSRVWGPTGTMLEGNNELAVALVVLVPFVYYLYQTNTRRLVRWGLVGSIAAIAFAVLGTQSRGALLALLAMMLVLGLKGRNPIRTTIVLTSLVVVAVAFMPDSWTQRMETIQGYKADTSAMSRLWTWQTMWNVAVDRPLVGAGFGTDNVAIFAKYAPVNHEYQAAEGQVWVAHSIYFQALGEHGFVGLGLYLMLGLLAWRCAGKLARATRDDPEFKTWVPLLMRMSQVSLVGFATGGAFLSLMHLDVPYYIIGIILLTDATVKERNRLPATSATTHLSPEASERGDSPKLAESSGAS